MDNSRTTLTGLFTDIADAIREKTGSTASIVAENFPTEIAAIDTQENLDPELSTQDNLIAQIASALEGKTGASGGAEIETCTVTLTDCMMDTRVIYTKLVDGVITSCNTLEGGTTYTDVVCGATIFVYDEGSDLVPTTVSGDATVLETNIFNGAGNVYLVNGDCTINMERYMER